MTKSNEPTEEQVENFIKVIEHESNVAMDEYFAQEIEAQPDKAGFLSGVQKSEFFRSLFTVAFASGVHWQKENKDTKFIL